MAKKEWHFYKRKLSVFDMMLSFKALKAGIALHHQRIKYKFIKRLSNQHSNNKPLLNEWLFIIN